MASRPLINAFSVITNGDMSGSLTSKVTIIDNLSMVSYQISWVGTSPLGSIVLEGSDDYTVNGAGAVSNPGNWVTLPLSATPTVTGNADSGMIDVVSTAIHAIRIRYIRTSGVGTLNALVTGKVA